jgi:hypothetical protein
MKNTHAPRLHGNIPKTAMLEALLAQTPQINTKNQQNPLFKQKPCNITELDSLFRFYICLWQMNRNKTIHLNIDFLNDFSYYDIIIPPYIALS